MRFIRVNVLKLTQVELFTFFRFKGVVANVSKLFYNAHLQIMKNFYTIVIFYFKNQV